VIELVRTARSVSPVLPPVVAALLIIIGIVIIVYPPVLVWIVGIAFILAGIAALAGTFMSS
jgi:hypothetical protein